MNWPLRGRISPQHTGESYLRSCRRLFTSCRILIESNLRHRRRPVNCGSNHNRFLLFRVWGVDSCCWPCFSVIAASVLDSLLGESVFLLTLRMDIVKARKNTSGSWTPCWILNGHPSLATSHIVLPCSISSRSFPILILDCCQLIFIDPQVEMAM